MEQAELDVLVATNESIVKACHPDGRISEIKTNSLLNKNYKNPS